MSVAVSRRTPPVRFVLAILAFALVFGATASSVRAAYTVVDLGAVGVVSGATAVASDASVVGYEMHGPAMPHATLFAHHRILDLGTLGGDASLAQAVASGDRVVGWARLPDATRHAFLYENGAMLDLGTLGGDMSQAFAINDAGVVVGSSIAEFSSFEEPWIWTHETGMTALPVPQLYGGQALGINASGVVVGYYIDDSGIRAFRWENGEVLTLGSLGGYAEKAYGVSPTGASVGYALTPDPVNPTFHPVVWDKSGNIYDYQPLEGRHGVAYDINSRGVAVGFSYTAADEQVAVRYEQGTAHDINLELPAGSPWRLNVASGITEDGVVTGTGTLDGITHAFALVPDEANGERWGLPSATVLRAYPQPMRDAGTIELTVKGEVRGRVSLYDVSGRRVAQLADGTFVRGTASIAVPSSVLSKLGAGVYFARFDGGGGSVSTRLVRVK